MSNQSPSENSSINQGLEIQQSNSELDRLMNPERILNITFPPQRQTSTVDSRYCWVCFATEEEDLEAGGVVEWIKPCKCKGTLRWVHQVRNCAMLIQITF